MIAAGELYGFSVHDGQRIRQARLTSHTFLCLVRLLSIGLQQAGTARKSMLSNLHGLSYIVNNLQPYVGSDFFVTASRTRINSSSE